MTSAKNPASPWSTLCVVATTVPSAEEAAYFREKLTAAHSRNARIKTMSDIYWTLLNSTEFSWNH